MLFILSGSRLPEHLIDIYRNIFVYLRVNNTPWELLLLEMNEISQWRASYHTTIKQRHLLE